MGLTAFNRARRRAAAAKEKAVPVVVDETTNADEENDEAQTVSIEKMTDDELVAHGKELGIKQASNMKRETLLKRIQEATDGGEENDD